MKKKLHALLVGIDKYEYINGLDGCLNDVDNMANYLRSRPDLDPQISILKNEEATKSNIVRSFREHLGAANENDLTVFFFAGHGTEEKTDIPAFRNSIATQNIYSFYCYN